MRHRHAENHAWPTGGAGGEFARCPEPLGCSCWVPSRRQNKRGVRWRQALTRRTGAVRQMCCHAARSEPLVSTCPHISVKMRLSASTDSRQRAAPATAAAIGPAITKPNRAGKSPRCRAFRAAILTARCVQRRGSKHPPSPPVGDPAAEAVRGAPGRAANWLRHGQRAPKNRVSQPGGAVRA